MRILLTGGGTGGHFFPLLALIREIKRIADEDQIIDLEFFYMATDDYGRDLLREAEVTIITVHGGKMRRYFSPANISDFFKTIMGIFQALWNMYLIYPDVVFSKGGHSAFPAVFAARVLRIPTIIHESDAVPGKVNRFAAGFARRIAIAFVGAQLYFPKAKTALVGIPLRKGVFGGSRSAAKETLNIFSDLPVIAYLGASQGAQKINEVGLDILKDLTGEYEVVHQTGTTNLAGVVSEAQVVLEFAHKERYHPFGFLDEPGMRDFYNVSDLIISRAGASSIFEIALWGKPSILIPLKDAAQDHQRENAYEYAGTGAALVIEEQNLTPHILYSEIKKVMDNTSLREKMSAAAKKFSRPDSAELIAREILKLGVHGESSSTDASS